MLRTSGMTIPKSYLLHFSLWSWTKSLNKRRFTPHKLFECLPGCLNWRHLPGDNFMPALRNPHDFSVPADFDGETTPPHFVSVNYPAEINRQTAGTGPAPDVSEIHTFFKQPAAFNEIVSDFFTFLVGGIIFSVFAITGTLLFEFNDIEKSSASFEFEKVSRRFQPVETSSRPSQRSIPRYIEVFFGKVLDIVICYVLRYNLVDQNPGWIFGEGSIILKVTPGSWKCQATAQRVHNLFTAGKSRVRAFRLR